MRCSVIYANLVSGQTTVFSAELNDPKKQLPTETLRKALVRRLHRDTLFKNSARVKQNPFSRQSSTTWLQNNEDEYELNSQVGQDFDSGVADSPSWFNSRLSTDRASMTHVLEPQSAFSHEKERI